MGFGVQDASLKVTKALPASNTTAVTDGINLGHGLKGDFLADAELLISVDAVATGLLGNAATHTFDVEHDTDPAFGTATAVYKGVLVQTGAGGVGAAATSGRVRLPVDVKPYVRVKVTKSDNVNASTKNFYAQLVF
jgi:hypothetical protein